MKKVKIALATIAVFAVVSGSLAFKANKFNTFTYYTRTSGAGAGTCGTIAHVFDNPKNDGTDVSFYTSTASAGSCNTLTSLHAE